MLVFVISLHRPPRYLRHESRIPQSKEASYLGYGRPEKQSTTQQLEHKYTAHWLLKLKAVFLNIGGVLVRVCIPVQNIVIKKQVGEERVYSACTSTLLFIVKGSQKRTSHRAGTWSQDLMQRPWGCCLLACFPWLAQLAFL